MAGPRWAQIPEGFSYSGANITWAPAGTLTITGAGISKYGDDTATLDFDGAGTVTETAMVAFTITPSGTITMASGGIGKYGDDTGTLDFNGSGAVTDTGVVSYALTPSAAGSIVSGTTLTLTGGTTCAVAATSGSALSLADGVGTIASTSGALTTTGMVTQSLSGLVTLAGELAVNRTAVTGAVTTAGAPAVLYAVTTGTNTITIQTADTVAGRVYAFIDEADGAAAANITIATEGSETIDGSNTTVGSTDGAGCILYSNGTNWFTLLKSGTWTPT